MRHTLFVKFECGAFFSFFLFESNILISCAKKKQKILYLINNMKQNCNILILYFTNWSTDKILNNYYLLILVYKRILK